MSAPLRYGLSLAGGLILALLVWRIGLAELASSVATAGWVLLPIVLLYGVVYLLNAAAWWVTMLDEPVRPSFARILSITISGFSLNFVTPVVNAGGEPFKAAAVAPWLGRRHATASVILYTMLHALSSLLLWLTAIGIGLVLLPRSALSMAALVALAAVVAALLALVLTGHRRGVLQALYGMLCRIPGLRRIARRLDDRRDALAEMDAQIAGFYHQQPKRFVLALTLDYLSRWVAALEITLICGARGIEIGLAEAVLVSGLSALVVNAMFFMPFELGSREGSLYVFFRQVGISAETAVFGGVISRLRELAWVGIGLGLISLAGGRRLTPAGAPAAGTRPASSDSRETRREERS